MNTTGTMLSKEHQAIWAKMIDLNWQIAMSKKITSWEDYVPVRELEKELKKSMGEGAYDAFIERGKKVFVPKFY